MVDWSEAIVNGLKPVKQARPSLLIRTFTLSRMSYVQDGDHGDRKRTPLRFPCVIPWLCIYINPMVASPSYGSHIIVNDEKRQTMSK